MKWFRKILMVTAALLALAPSSIFACATCHGRSDSPMAYGMNAGIFTLMGVIGIVLTCIALFFVHVIRGEARTQAGNPGPDANPKSPTGV
ncbi:MAG TPA: hypothetical protein VFY06_03220 [Verrucomicrobiae bacterium]|nr:hypothetical protein [Verrucomicrobiae bacterium]